MIKSRLALTLGLILAGLIVAPIDTRAAAKMPGKTYVHETLAFSMKVISDWTETPIRVDFKARGIVAKLKAEGRGGDFASLDVYRFGADLTETTPTEGDDGGADEVQRELERIRRQTSGARSAEEALRRLLDAYTEGVNQRIAAINRQSGGEPLELVPQLELPKPRTYKRKDTEYLFYSIFFEHEKLRWGGTLSRFAGIARSGEEEYLLLFDCEKNQRRKYEMSFYATTKSFRFPDGKSVASRPDDEPEDEPEIDEDSEIVDPEKRARVRKGLIASWDSFDTPHYIVLYHKNDVRLSRIIGKRIELLRTLWEQDFPPVKPITACMVIRLCPDTDTYFHYGAPRGSGGYWASGHDEFVFPSFTRSTKKADDTTLGVLHHEGWHQYFHYALEGRPTPIAMNEGLAEYYFCAEPIGREKFRIGNRHPMRFGTVKTAASTGALIPFKTFIRLTQGEHYSRAQLCYSEGWALFYWLMQGTKDPRYKEIPRKLFQALAEQPAMGGWSEKPWEDAVNKVLEGIDEDQLHEDFLKGIKKVL